MRDTIGRHVAVIHRYARRFFHVALAEYDLPFGAPPVLMQVLRGPAPRQEQLAVRLGLDEGTISRLVTRLEAEGLVERRPDPQDHRARTLHPTPQLEALAPRLRAAGHRLEERLMRRLSLEESASLTALLRRVAEDCAEDDAQDAIEIAGVAARSVSQHQEEGQ